MYNAIGNINRVLASDPRLWTYLALMTHRDYMITRWGWKQEENFAEAVARRWIMPQSRARNMVRHGIARLWWVPKLTYDDTLRFPMSQSQDDPFAYSSWILGSEERLKSLFEGLIGRTPAIRWAAMNSLSKAPANMPARFGARELAKKINLEAGFRNIQALPEDALQSLVDDLMGEVIELHNAQSQSR